MVLVEDQFWSILRNSQVMPEVSLGATLLAGIAGGDHGGGDCFGEPFLTPSFASDPPSPPQGGPFLPGLALEVLPVPSRASQTLPSPPSPGTAWPSPPSPPMTGPIASLPNP